MFGARVFRVFISSTFTDMAAERNALQERVFGELRTYCAGKGFGFQPVDLRWGISDEASAGQRTMRICLAEIARCQAVSPRPNFVVLLGDRYGWRPLPEVIAAAEFEALRAALPAEGLALADACYERDDNGVPPVYTLRPKTGDAADRDDAQARLRPLLARAAEEAELEAAALAKYRCSATEQEIIEGALTPADADEHVFCFLRAVPDLPADAGAFRDLASDGRPDAEAAGMLADLKARLKARLRGHVFEYEAPWHGDAPGTGHLDALCADMLAALRRVIDAEVDRLASLSHLDLERYAHDEFAAARAFGFVGRARYLDEVDAYVRDGPGHPLCIFSEGGFGKSSLVATAARRARAAHAGAVMLTRHLGVTSASADLRSLLRDLCAEIGAAYGHAAPVPSTLQALRQELPARLALATAERPLFVFLDALDQLTAGSGAHLSWLPSDLPADVRIVVTTRAGAQLDGLRRRLPAAQVIELGPMPADEGGALLDAWLADAGRTLGPVQRADVLERFARSGSPLYLRLAFEDARLWTARTPAAPRSTNVPGLIGDLYDRLAAEHGRELVSHALGFLAATYDRLGLSEEELLAALAADDHTWAEFTAGARWEMLVRQLPVVVWSRVYFDLAPYLSPRVSDGTPLMSFFHQELADVARRRFVAGSASHLHDVLAGVMHALARGANTSARPWAGSTHALAELPHHLTGAGRWDDVYATLTDFTYLEEKAARVAVVSATDANGRDATTYNGVLALIDDFDGALAAFPED